MSTLELRTSAVPIPSPGRTGDEASQVLASALAHLLDRGGELPARWTTPAFGLAVEAARAMAWPPGPTGLAAGAPSLDFEAAARRLAREPWDVAVAIRQLERRMHRSLPAWDDLLRRGLPARATALDTSLWFG